MTWTVTCPCECEVCIVLYPIFARISREARGILLHIRKCFRFGQARRFTNLARSSHEWFPIISFSRAMAPLAARSQGHARPQAFPAGRAH